MKNIKCFQSIILIMIMSIFLNSCQSQYLAVEKNVDIQKYLGTWYEIARFPHSFEKGLENVSATYSLKENGKIKVLNKGQNSENELSEIKGVAWIPDAKETAKLKVRFFWPFSGNYWIISLDKDYQYVLVGEPSRKYLWILARTKTLDDNIYSELIRIAKERGFDTDKLMKVKQN